MMPLKDRDFCGEISGNLAADKAGSNVRFSRLGAEHGPASGNDPQEAQVRRPGQAPAQRGRCGTGLTGGNWSAVSPTSSTTRGGCGTGPGRKARPGRAAESRARQRRRRSSCPQAGVGAVRGRVHPVHLPHGEHRRDAGAVPERPARHVGPVLGRRTLASVAQTRDDVTDLLTGRMGKLSLSRARRGDPPESGPRRRRLRPPSSRPHCQTRANARRPARKPQQALVAGICGLSTTRHC